MRTGLALLCGLWCACIGAARAENRPAGLPTQIARLDLVSGEVTFRLPTDSSWSEADYNYPIYSGMTLTTGEKARAEIGIGPNALQMSSDTTLDMTTLSSRLTDVAVHRGRVHLNLHRLRPGESIELELPDGSVWLLDAGSYDIDLTSGDSPTRVTVLDGKARFVDPKNNIDIAANQQAMLHEDEKVTLQSQNLGLSPAAQPGLPSGPDAAANPNSGGTTPPGDAAQPSSTADEFIKWSAGRDAIPITDVPKNLARDTSGYASLDAYGDWQTTDAYGKVWFPKDLPPDWQPYRFGHWVSVPPWGPTWVDDEPWGFVPFHYGRWAQIDGRWGWVPGDPDQNAVYAPALVAFIGSPDDATVADDDGNPAVGWVPLGPDEPYDPWYQTDDTYIQQVNAASVHDFHDLSRDRLAEMRRLDRFDHFANGHFATVVSRDTFANARPVAAAMAHMSAERMGRLAMATGAPRVGLTEGTRRAPDPARVAAMHPEPAPTGAAHGGEAAHGEAGRPEPGGHPIAAREGMGPGEREAVERGAGRLPTVNGAYHPPATGAMGAYRPPGLGPAGVYHPPGMGAMGAYHPPGLGAAGVYHPPGMSAFGGRPGGFGGFQVPAARGMPMGRAPAVHAAPSGGGGRRR